MENQTTLLLNKEWRIDNLYTIVDKKGVKRKFIRNSAQLDFDKNKHCKNIILKSRRLGFTTYEAIDNLDDTLFTENFSALFLAHTKDDAIEIFDTKVDFCWKNIDSKIANLWKVDASSARKLKFDFGDNTFSQIKVALSGRSGTYNRIHSTEYAKLCVKYPAQSGEFISGTIQSLTPDGRMDIESTAEGMAGNFFEMFTEAWYRKRKPLKAEFKAHFYNWQWEKDEMKDITPIDVEQMDESQKFISYQKQHNLTDVEITYYYFKWLSLKKDWDKLHEQYPTTPEEAFVASGNCFFNQERIRDFMINCPQPIEVDEEKIPKFLLSYYRKKELLIWELPEEYSLYVAGGDVAEGKGQDRSVLNGINNKTLKTVFSFKSDTIQQDDYAKVCNRLGRWYNKAYLGIESNSGLWVLNCLMEKHEYPNMYFREKIDDITHKVSKQVGFHTGGVSRKSLVDNLLVDFNQYDIWNNKDFLIECLTFIKDDRGRPEAQEGKHDDEVIATAIAYYIRENMPIETKRPEPEDYDPVEALKRRFEKMNETPNKQVRESDYY